jgi:hypothetical protein
MYDGGDWQGRASGQPFFMQVQLAGGKLRVGTAESALRLSECAQSEFSRSTRPDAMQLPLLLRISTPPTMSYVLPRPGRRTTSSHCRLAV